MFSVQRTLVYTGLTEPTIRCKSTWMWDLCKHLTASLGSSVGQRLSNGDWKNVMYEFLKVCRMTAVSVYREFLQSRCYYGCESVVSRVFWETDHDQHVLYYSSSFWSIKSLLYVTLTNVYISLIIRNRPKMEILLSVGSGNDQSERSLSPSWNISQASYSDSNLGLGGRVTDSFIVLTASSLCFKKFGKFSSFQIGLVQFLWYHWRFFVSSLVQIRKSGQGWREMNVFLLMVQHPLRSGVIVQ